MKAYSSLQYRNYRESGSVITTRFFFPRLNYRCAIKIGSASEGEMLIIITLKYYGKLLNHRLLPFVRYGGCLPNHLPLLRGDC